jgi:NAD(P)-dependent dehydrogenase (short-subunit alcohol dehydrogenase family)
LNEEIRMSGICKGRVVIITGAGGGLGRGYALALATEGASVLVNDIRREAAEAVVAEITKAGGKALANSDDITSMSGAQSIVDAAVKAFGDVHGVVNNAGVVRDRMFASLSEEDWDLVIKVHLKGHFCIASTLVRRWRDQAKAGQKIDARIINTSSGAGLQGSIGQSNYAAAKGGIASLTLVQAAELGRYGITVNALAPAARTGMTEPVFGAVMKKPDDGSFDHFAPENVAPLVVWLCSPLSAQVTGKVFEVEGGKLSIGSGWRTGPVRDKKARWTPSELTDVVDALIAESPKAQKVYGT